MKPAAEHALGALMVVAAMTLIPSAEGIAKHLMDSYPPLQVVWARFAVHFLLLAPFVIFRYRGKLLREFRPRAQMIRGALMFSSVLLFMLSIAIIPLARAVALFAVAPFVVALLSFAILGERTRAAHFICIAFGFCGVVLIARPDSHVFEWANLLAVGGGILYAFYLVASRKLTGSAPAIVGGFFAALIGALFLAPLMPFIAIAPLAASHVMMKWFRMSPSFRRHGITGKPSFLRKQESSQTHTAASENPPGRFRVGVPGKENGFSNPFILKTRTGMSVLLFLFLLLFLLQSRLWPQYRISE